MKTLCFFIAIVCCLAGARTGFPQDKIPTLPAADTGIQQPEVKKTHNPSSGRSVKSQWDIKFFWNLTSLTGNAGNAGIVYLTTNGEIWISRWNSDTLFRWTSSNYIYTFTIPGVSGVRAMTFDGTKIYAANATTSILIIDPNTKTLTGTIQAPKAVRYVTYDPAANQGKGGLWVGNYSTDPQLISLSGSVLRTLSYANLGTTSIYGAAYDGSSPGGPYIWFFGQTGGYASAQEIAQVSLTTGNATGTKRDITFDLADYAASLGIYADPDSMLAGGLCLVKGVFPGIVALGGIMQGSPNIIFALEIAAESSTPQVININKTFTFGDPEVSSSYRIISLPGNISMPLSELFSSAGEQKKNWNAFYDNGAAANYLVEYNNSSSFTFKPGSAFWVVSRNALNVTKNVNPVTLDNFSSYQIPLHSGWNLIASPFNSAVNWANVLLANGLAANNLIYAWEGSWSSPSAIQPYQGYYFNNINNLVSLSIPVPVQVGKTSPDLQKSASYIPEKCIKAALYSEDRELSAVYASVDKRSGNDFDELDYFIPPSDFSELCMHIENKDLQTQYKHLFIDSRPDMNDGQVYDIVLKNSLKRNAELRFTGMENFEGYEIFLADRHLKRFYNLRENPNISLDPLLEKQEFNLIVGKQSFIEEKKSSLLPKDYLLLQNYPNPFNPYTVITYEIPSQVRVELTVYNVLGKEVTRLVDEVESPGRYEVKFQAERLPSGIYFCTIKSGGFTKTQKMVLMK
ncbi:MAG: T9SS type A sorting domain-containing protein [archaeon]